MRKFLIYIFSIGWIVPIWIGLSEIVSGLRKIELGTNQVNSIGAFFIYSLLIKIGLIWLVILIMYWLHKFFKYSV